MIFVAPGIELPLHGGARAVGAGDRNVGPISRAQESSSGTSKISALPAVASFASATSCGRAAIDHGLEGRDRPRHARDGLFGAQQPFRPAPGFRAARPAHPGARMWRPFRGHGIAVARGTWIVGIEPFGHGLYSAPAAVREPLALPAHSVTFRTKRIDMTGKIDARLKDLGHHAARRRPRRWRAMCPMS